MKEMTVSITGCGWLGMPLAEKLISEGAMVKGTTTREAKLSLLEGKGIQPLLVKYRAEGVEGDLPSLLDTDILVVNIPPGRKAVEEAMAYPGKIACLTEEIDSERVKGGIFISSTSVYGNLPGKVLEDTQPAPLTTSGKVLLEVEKELMGGSFPWTVLRLGGLIGPDRHPGRFFRKKEEVDKGDAPVNLVGLEDAIGVIQQIIQKEKWGETYHLASTHHPTKRDFYSMAIEEFGGFPPRFNEGGDTSKEIDSTYTLNSLAYQLTGENLFDYVRSLSGKARKM